MKKAARNVLYVLLGILAAALLLGLSPLILLVLLIPIVVVGAYEDGKFAGSVRYGLIRISFPGKPKPEAAEASSGEKKPSKGEKKKSAKPKQPLSEKLGLVQTLLSSGLRGVGSLLRHLDIRALSAEVRAATGDAADTALLYGRLNAVAGLLFAPLYAAKRLGELHVRITPDFDGEKTDWRVRGTVAVQGIWIVGAAVSIGWALFRYMIRQNINAVSASDKKKDNLKGGTHMAHPIENLLGTSIQKIKEMVDVNTVIGDPIHVSDKITIIPVSRVSFGFASGGSDIPSKQEKELFGGGAGAGVKMDPLAFIVVNGDDVKIVPYAPAPVGGADRAVAMVPDVIDKISGLFSKKKGAAEPQVTEIKSDSDAAVAPAAPADVK